jgi:hypothetical protein
MRFASTTGYFGWAISLTSIWENAMTTTRKFVLALSIASMVVLSACTQQAAAPIRTVDRDAAPTTPVAIPVAPPTTNFDAGATGSTGASPQAAQPVTQSQAPSWTTSTAQAPTTASAVMVGGQAQEGEHQLALVQVCQANAMGVRNQCAMGFADTLTGREVTSQVQSYFLSTSASLAPKVSFDNYCSPGWLATVISSQGTVQGGGVLQTLAAVCGHPSPGQALTALFNACDAQTQGGCRQSTSLNVAWGYWDGKLMSGSEADIGRPYSAERFADAHMCESTLPLIESGVCPSSAAVPLRLLGLP